MPQEDLERVFELIQKGKTEGSEEKHWDAAGSFLEARCLLQDLANNHPTENEEEQKIRDLYLAQSEEYLHRSRASLIDAMKKEYETDKEEKCMSCQELSIEDVTKRNDLFSTIFSKPAEKPIHNDTAEDDNDKVTSLEERLAELTASLPKGLKSDKERMNELNQKMKGLGIVVTSNYDPNKVEPPKSSSQQVADIIAQAQDEVAMGVQGTDENIHNNNNDHTSVSFSDNDYLSDVDDDDSLLSDDVPELQNTPQIRDEIAATQAKLAELQALMEEVMPTGEQAEEEETETKPSNNFDPIAGKKKLKQAKKSLHKALKLWKVKAKQI